MSEVMSENWYFRVEKKEFFTGFAFLKWIRAPRLRVLGFLRHMSGSRIWGAGVGWGGQPGDLGMNYHQVTQHKLAYSPRQEYTLFLVAHEGARSAGLSVCFSVWPAHG